MGNEKSGSPWDKRGIYLRLSKRRKARLLAIAKELGHEDSPHRALAAYIEDEDRDSQSNTADPLAGLEDIIGEAIGQRFDALARSVAVLERRMAETIDELSNALSPLTALPQEDDTSQPLVEWLARVETAAGMEAKQGIVIRAWWRATNPCEGGTISLEFESKLARIDNRDNIASMAGLTRVDNIAPTDPLIAGFQASTASGLLLACQPSGSGSWAFAAFSLNPDGSIGCQFASRRL